MGQVSQATGSSTPMGSPMGSLVNGLSRRADPISILYFTTFLPAFSAIWRRRYPLFRTLDTGKLSLFSLRRPGMEHCPIVRALLNKLSLIPRAMRRGGEALHETRFLRFFPSSFRGISPQRRIKIINISRCFRESGMSSS